jgi:hypothetical protein
MNARRIAATRRRMIGTILPARHREPAFVKAVITDASFAREHLSQ